MTKSFRILKAIFTGIFLIGLLIPKSGFSQDLPNPSNPPRLVNDFSEILSPEEKMQLESKLVAFNDSTSTQIAVVIVDDLQGLEPWEYATKIGEKWGVGQAGKENGIVILIKPSGGKGQKKVFIAVGKGLEGIIPDAIANRIVDNEMIPHFKQGDYLGGINAAVDVLQGLALKDFAAADYDKKIKAANKAPLGLLAVGFIFLIIFIFIVPAFKARSYANTNNIAFWAAFWLLMNSGKSSGNYNHFRNGTGGFGGFGGGGFGGGSSGGFGGFGGGSFGGGGAGGSW